MAADENKPIFLLCHGACHPPKLYDPLKQALAFRGYIFITPALPTTGADSAGVSVDVDTATLLAHAEPFFEQGKEVVLVGHSYGGIPASLATRSNSVQERAAAGRPGGFRHMIFLCGLAIPAPGMSAQAVMPKWPWRHTIGTEDGRKQLFPDESILDAIYNGLPPEKAQEYFEALIPVSYTALTQPIDFAASEITVPKTYIVCEDDRELPSPGLSASVGG
ncbi:hypothetical protein AAE478_002932 [Parahypoxylon ruwenzoriense]